MHKYDAFISYSRTDKEFAGLLETKLEKYKPPKSIRTPSRHFNVFRDEGDLSGTDYHDAIEQHLESSAKLIVICSPEAAKSEYVIDEIESFLKFNKPENIITILLHGIPNNEASEKTKHLCAFPKIIGDVQRMPLAKDYRNFDIKTQKVNKGVFQHNWFKLLADILDKSIDEVTEKETKRKIRNRNQWITIVASAFIVLLSLTIYALNQKSIAEDNQEKAVQEAKRADKNAENEKEQRERAEYEAQRALDSARVAQEQRKYAQEQAQRANDSARSAQIQRTLAVLEAQRANDSAKVAQEQRGIAQEQTIEAIKQTGIAIKNEAETNRINELLLAENLSFQSLSLENPESKRNTALEAYDKYKDCALDTSADASREMPIYEALYKLAGNNALSTKMECKYLFMENDQLLGFGNDINGANSPGYFIMDPDFSQTTLQIFPKNESPANYFFFLPESKTLITCHDDHSFVFWKVNNNQLELLIDFQLGDGELIREVAYSSELKVIAAAGNGPNVHLFHFQNNSGMEMLNTIHTDSERIVGLSFRRKDLLVFHQNGDIQEINSLLQVSDKKEISNSSIITTTSTGEIGFLGLVDGKIAIFNPDKMLVEGSVPFSGNTRVELLYVNPSGEFLISSYADRAVHIYDLKYISDPYYKPRVINDLDGKVRSLIVDDTYLYMSLSNKTIVKYDLNMDRLAISLGYPNYNMTMK